MAETTDMNVIDTSKLDEQFEIVEEVSRPTAELIVGMVGAVGAGVSKTTLLLKEALEDHYGYKVQIVKASEIIRDNADKVRAEKPADTGAKRITDLQHIGTELRDKFGEDYVAGKAIELIAAKRERDGGYDDDTTVPQPKSLRQVTIIDSLKHPKESNLLRRVYGGIYWQFTVFAPENIREERLKKTGIERTDLAGIFTRDESDVDDHGQQVSKTTYLSDFFIRNDSENEDRLITIISRFLEIVFNIKVHTPTKQEAGMQTAISAASKSACLSRQVGAAIFSKENELISVGWNDVPKANGGLYTVEDGQHDHRCYKWGGKICHNDHKKEDLYEKIFTILSEYDLLARETTQADIRDALIQTPVRNLIEYSRSIHAEMEAIVSASRAGKSGMVGGILYTSTFPCHNCARHIVAAGIKTVYYIEPYSKSLAFELHHDALGNLADSNRKVEFLQYEGVGPERMMKLFQHGSERKHSGKAVEQNKKIAIPVLPPPMDGFTTHEKQVIKHIMSVEGS